jgi:hypothetical protein
LEKGEFPEDDPLWIVHDFDRIDKHRELVIVESSIGLKINANLLYKFVISKEKASGELSDEDVKMNTQVAANISFRQFGKREYQPVIPGLFKLGQYVRDFIGLFSDEFP